ncbi:uncharacterized protein LOC106152896 [Lingula anatina]|uniref:Uncharacterized protein LOC106152896 n=1 Tax=Lingula anatina TaxID=7574 RepID=A0A1S3H7K0_LINAN|nr:uncharacterized protein LOC106152896 [Lingula anatina]|eukprot:XP_013382090.1 uncharacterized protein LOC106152896 [Lingula anatina]
MRNRLVSLQSDVAAVADAFKELTFEVYQLLTIARLRSSYGSFSGVNQTIDIKDLEVLKTELDDIKNKVDTGLEGIVNQLLEREVENLLSTLPVPVPFSGGDILDLLGIGSNKRKQREYENKLKSAKSTLEEAKKMVDHSLRRIEADCAKIQSAWPELQKRVTSAFRNVFKVTVDLGNAFPGLKVQLSDLRNKMCTRSKRSIADLIRNKIRSGLKRLPDLSRLAASFKPQPGGRLQPLSNFALSLQFAQTQKCLEDNHGLSGPYSNERVSGISSALRGLKNYLNTDFHNKVNGALEDILGPFTKEQLPKLIGIADRIVKLMKVNSTLDAILSRVSPLDNSFTTTDAIRMISGLFPQQKCYLIYPLSFARSGASHPTYTVPTTDKLFEIRNDLVDLLDMAGGDCNAVPAAREFIGRRHTMSDGLFNYLVKSSHPEWDCVTVSGDVC